MATGEQPDPSPQRHDEAGSEQWQDLDELTDRLIDKREKFQYFIVSAATAIIVFTFNDANSPAGVLHSAPQWMPFLGWICLALASGFSLLGIWSRHNLNWAYISMRYRGLSELPSTEGVRRNRLVKNLRRIQGAVALLLTVGTGFLAWAYTEGIAETAAGG